MTQEADAFLKEILLKIDDLKGDEFKCSDYIFDMFDDVLLEDNWELIELVLSKIKIKDFSAQNLINILSVTLPYKAFLGQSREKFLGEVLYVCKSELGAERAEKILEGFI